MAGRGFTVAAAVNDRRTLMNNLLRSPDIHRGECSVVIKENFHSASLAYNSALDEAENDIVVFAHQDVYLPEGWFAELSRHLLDLEQRRIRWGVLGVFGSNRTVHGGLGLVYTTGRGFHGNRIDHPEPVETLDEIVLVLKKSSGLRFDSSLPHFHFYGTDICMLSTERGFVNCSIPAFCVHNTNQLLSLPNEFYDCYSYIKKKWANHLPIYTSCIKVSRFDEDLRWRKIRDVGEKVFRRRQVPVRRMDDPRVVLSAWRVPFGP